MAKRKIDCSLDDIVMEFLQQVKCEKASKTKDRYSEGFHKENKKTWNESWRCGSIVQE